MNFPRTTLLAALTLFSLAAAQAASAAIHLPEERARIRQGVRDAAEKIRREKSDARPGATTTGDVMMKKEETGRMMREKREEFKKEMEAKRDAMRAGVEKRREELKARLQQIKDERKKQAVERIDDAIVRLNERQTSHLADALDKLEQVLERVGSRADKGQTKGLDVSAVRNQIAGAQTLIASAREAVGTQAEKAYTIAVTTENNLKTDVGKTRQTLHADLTKVRDAVRAAHDAIRKAATALAQIPAVDEEPSSSGIQPNTEQNR